MNEVVVELLKIRIMEFRFIFVNVALFKKFELWGNNWSLQINGQITKSRFIWTSQSCFIFVKVALYKKFELRSELKKWLIFEQLLDFDRLL